MPLYAQAAETASPIPTPGALQKGSSGNDVLNVQAALRALGYLNFRVTGKYSDITTEAVKRFQKDNQLDPDGQVGGKTLALLLSGNASPAARNPKFKVVFGPRLLNPNRFGEISSWAEISAAFPVGATVTIQDLYSEKTFQMKRTGGRGCARVETVRESDTDTFVSMFGGESTWEKRAVLATIGGVTYAAGLFGAPDGEDTIGGNGMDGATILYFSGSTTDVFGIPDEELKNAVMEASNTFN